MNPSRRRMDRAQRDRARRQWVSRNGAFVTGVALGVVITLIAVWAVKLWNP